MTNPLTKFKPIPPSRESGYLTISPNPSYPKPPITNLASIHLGHFKFRPNPAEKVFLEPDRPKKLRWRPNIYTKAPNNSAKTYVHRIIY
ncbi:hypothetical protein DSO57_1032326 [Entomophthora muscae]|uniref:Uncharacterized protein n=1 Tax=Entomophthora muscae TaxID=34485 RepID=A0ACC2SD75_9FUNG|nr:hypothetical protein DSO57_1032326 [Entomophthora muscae]